MMLSALVTDDRDGAATAEEVRKVLPHREPFLLIDRVISCKPGSFAVCEMDVTGEQDFFRGHFPGEPVMPGVLVMVIRLFLNRSACAASAPVLISSR